MMYMNAAGPLFLIRSKCTYSHGVRRGGFRMVEHVPKYAKHVTFWGVEGMSNGPCCQLPYILAL